MGNNCPSCPTSYPSSSLSTPTCPTSYPSSPLPTPTCWTSAPCPTSSPCPTCPTSSPTSSASPRYSLSTMIYPGFYLLGAIKPNVMIDTGSFRSMSVSTIYTISFNVQYLLPPLVFITCASLFPVSPSTTLLNFIAAITEITSTAFKITGNYSTDNYIPLISYIAIGIVSGTNNNNISSTPLSCSLTMTDGSRSPIYLPKVASINNAIIDIGNVPNNLGITTTNDSGNVCENSILSTYSYRQSSSQPPVASSTPTPLCLESMSSPFNIIFSGDNKINYFFSIESKASSGTTHWNNVNRSYCSSRSLTQLTFTFNIYNRSNTTVNVKYLAIGPTCLSSSIPSLGSSVPGIVGRNLVIDYGITPVYNSNTGSCFFNFTFASIPPLVLISIANNVNTAISIRHGSITTSGFTYDISGTQYTGTVMYMAIGPISC